MTFGKNAYRVDRRHEMVFLPQRCTPRMADIFVMTLLCLILIIKIYPETGSYKRQGFN